jgi:hypothetical protein
MATPLEDDRRRTRGATSGAQPGGGRKRGHTGGGKGVILNCRYFLESALSNEATHIVHIVQDTSSTHRPPRRIWHRIIAGLAADIGYRLRIAIGIS